MTVTFRDAVVADLPAIVALLRDDVLGQGREGDDLARYRQAFAVIEAHPDTAVIVGEAAEGRIVALYELTILHSLTLNATRRAQVEGVRVAGDLRGQGIGHQMLADAEARARAAGCGLVQLTMNATRQDSRRFYEALGFEASHIGFKRVLD